MPAAANVSPITIETTFAMNIGFLLAFLSEENHNRTKRGTNIAEQMQVTISNWYNGLNDVTSMLMNCPCGLEVALGEVVLGGIPAMGQRY